MIAKEEYWIERIGKHLSGNISGEERDGLMQWLESSEDHRDLYSHLETIWSKANEPIVNFDDKEDYWEAIEQVINETSTESQTQPVNQRRTLWRVAAAAAVLLLAVFARQTIDWNTLESTPQLVELTTDDNNRQVTLPDGSVVWLREGSSLTYDQRFDEREVILHGEGYFEIKADPNRPFAVQVGNATARVLGTKFNLREMGNGEVELYVTEGKVAFSQSATPEQNVIVTRDQVAVAKLSDLAPTRVEMLPGDVNRLSWQTTRLVFNHVSLKQILRDVERHFTVEFVVQEDGLLDCEMKADFDNVTLKEILETIEFSLNCTIDFKEGRYFISGEPCNTSIK